MQTTMSKKLRVAFVIILGSIALLGLKFAFGDKAFVLMTSFLVIVMVSAGIAKNTMPRPSFFVVALAC
ncbi:hypothetical protein ACQ86O_11560 [Serratia sp. L9]|uniref:hypothetical protein n=1 Tax=Serratia sp. L9 TaxID=3423946 RepID=UPI003D6737E3